MSLTKAQRLVRKQGHLNYIKKALLLRGRSFLSVGYDLGIVHINPDSPDRSDACCNVMTSEEYLLLFK